MGPKVAPPTMGWDPPTSIISQNEKQNKKPTIGQSRFLTEVPSSRMAVACLKLTKKKKTNQDNTHIINTIEGQLWQNAYI